METQKDTFTAIRCMSVGVMKDYKLKQRNLRASHTLEGCTRRSTTSRSIVPSLENPGLPVFCSAAPTLVPMKVRSTRWWDEASKALLSGHLAGFLVCARKFICFHAFLLAYVCIRHAPRRSWASRALRNDVRALVYFYTPLHYWRWVCDGWSWASQLHCAGSVAANHASTRLRIMWLRALRWCFSSTMVTGDVSWALLDFVGGVTCDVCSCASQLHCAGSIAANHACTRLHIHAISYFKVTFSCSFSSSKFCDDHFSALFAAMYVTFEGAEVNYVVTDALQPTAHAHVYALMT